MTTVNSEAIKGAVDELAKAAWRNRLDPKVHMFARKLTDGVVGNRERVVAIADEAARISRQVKEDLGPLLTEALALPTDGAVEDLMLVDADEVCLVVAAAAMSVGIQCRLVGARYGRSWTCWVAYEAEAGSGRWATVDPVKRDHDSEPDETVFSSEAIGQEG